MLASLDVIGQRALSSRETLKFSRWAVMNVCYREAPGDLVECGVFAGAQVGAMALELLEDGKWYDTEPSQRIHLYDSFEGLPQAGPMDDVSITDLIGPGDGSLRTTGVSACSEDQVRSNLAGWGFPPELFVFHPGWFQEVLPQPEHRPSKIALLRLDGDLFESTLCCLHWLYRLVSPGGIVIVDDYALTGCRRAVDRYFKGDSLDEPPEQPNWLPIDGRGPVYGVKP